MLQGSYLFAAPDTAGVSDKDWIQQWNVQIGIGMFIVGWLTNQHADYILRHLRDAKPSEKQRKTEAGSNSRYHIPYGGMFRFTSAANYTGEIIEWAGFALAAWSLPALAFLIFTMTNLVPRGCSYHAWYKKTFPNYPKDRKAVIPFAL